MKPVRWGSWKEGVVLRVPLRDGSHTYAVLRRRPLVAVFDCRSLGESDEADMSAIVACPVVCSVWVEAAALRCWTAVGVVPLPAPLAAADVFVKRDPLSGRVSLYSLGAERGPATPEQARTLEVAGVWSEAQLVARIEDYYAGRPNRSEVSLRNFLLTGDGRVP